MQNEDDIFIGDSEGEENTEGIEGVLETLYRKLIIGSLTITIIKTFWHQRFKEMVKGSMHSINILNF